MADAAKYLRLLCALINQKEARDFDFGRAARDIEQNLPGVETQWRRLRHALREKGLPAAPRGPRATRQRPARLAAPRARVREVQKDLIAEADTDGDDDLRKVEIAQVTAASNKASGSSEKTEYVDEKQDQEDQKSTGRDVEMDGTAGEHEEVDESSLYYEEECPDEI